MGFTVAWEFASLAGKLRANATHLPATWNGGSYGNVFVSAKVQFSALNGSLTVAGRLGSYSGGIPAAGYAAELLSNGQVKLWRLSDWAQLGSTYTISGFQSGQTVTLGLRLNGSSLSVEIDGVTRISATDSTFSTGEVGLWSYQPTAANQHIFDDFLVQNLGQGYMLGSKVRAVENALVKIAHRGNELRKAQSLQAPPAGHAWTSYYFAGSARVAMRVQVNGSADQVYYLLADHASTSLSTSLGSTTVSYRSDGGETRFQQYYPWGALRPGPGTSLPTDRTFNGQRWSASIGLSFFNARWLDSSLGRFISPDTIIPELYNALDWDRYSFVRNNPIKYTDPSGHMAWEGESSGCRNTVECREEKQNLAIYEASKAENKCANGNANYCAGWANGSEKQIFGIHAGAGATMDLGYGGYTYEQTDYVFDIDSGTIFVMKTTGEGNYLGVPNGVALEGYLGITNIHGIPSSATPDQVANLLSGPNVDIAGDVGLDFLPDIEMSFGKGSSIDIDPDTGKPFITSVGPMYATESKIGAGINFIPIPIGFGGQFGNSETWVPHYYQLPFWPSK